MKILKTLTFYIIKLPAPLYFSASNALKRMMVFSRTFEVYFETRKTLNNCNHETWPFTQINHRPPTPLPPLYFSASILLENIKRISQRILIGEIIGIDKSFYILFNLSAGGLSQLSYELYLRLNLTITFDIFLMILLSIWHKKAIDIVHSTKVDIRLKCSLFESHHKASGERSRECYDLYTLIYINLQKIDRKYNFDYLIPLYINYT